MKELIILIIIAGLSFLLFLVTLIMNLTKKNRALKLASFLFFFAFIGFSSWTAFKFVNKSYNKLAKAASPRTGDEIYDALFGKRQADCIKILHYQDQVIPKIDYAIWLHFETCPKELERILSRHAFTVEKLSAANRDGKIPYAETLAWFNPATLGDTIIVYEYSTNDSRNIQTIWTNPDSTQAFVRDILD
ncbi:MAG: hypothetical protein QM687_09730 [Ferruginibacter sp.]